VTACGMWDWGCMWEEGLEALKWKWVDWCVSVCEFYNEDVVG